MGNIAITDSAFSDKQSFRWVILGLVFLVQCTASLLLFSFGPLAPFLRDEFSLTRAETGIFFSLIYCPQMLFGVFGGWLIDKWGIRRLLLFGVGMFTVFYTIFSLTPSVGLGYFIAILMGFGYIFVTPTTTMALVHWFPARARATVIGIKQSALTVGAAIGAIVVPYLCLVLSWRHTVAICGGIAAMLIIISYATYRKSSNKPIIIENITFKSIRRVLSNKNLIIVSICCAFLTALQMAILNYLVLEMVETRKLSELVAGNFLMLLNLGGTVGRVFWGVISDKVFKGWRNPVLSITGTSSGIIFIFISLVGATIPFWLLYIIIPLLGITALGWTSVFLTLASESTARETAATSVSCAVSIITVGAILGPPIFGYIVDITSSYSSAWLIFGIMAIVAAIPITLIGK